MSGPVALVGAGEFTAALSEVDAGLLETTGRSRPRVAVVAIASASDDEVTSRRLAAQGVEHFSALGAEVEAVLVCDRADADDPEHAQAVGEADLIYVAGGKSDHLLRVLAGSAVWTAALRAHSGGAVLAGCSAGAMVLAARQPALRGGRLPFPIRWDASLGIIDGVAVIPHYDRIPEPVAAFVALQAPRGVAILGIDADTALVGRDGSWQVLGRARVTVWRGRHRTRLRAGDVVRL